MVWVFERTGRSAGIATLSPEEEDLQALKSELIQQRAVYAPTAPTIRMLENRIAVLEDLVEEQRAARALPGEDGAPAAPLSELDVELAPIDERLKFIAEEKAMIEETLAELEASVQATPANEMVLGGLERELASLQDQYNNAVASRGQAQVGERIEVLSKGERFSLIEQPTMPTGPYSPNRKLIAAAGLVGRRRRGHRLHRADGDAEPLDPPAGRPLGRARPAALRHGPLHPHPGRDPLEAGRGARDDRGDRGGDPGGPPRAAQLLSAARPAARASCSRRSASPSPAS